LDGSQVVHIFGAYKNANLAPGLDGVGLATSARPKLLPISSSSGDALDVGLKTFATGAGAGAADRIGSHDHGLNGFRLHFAVVAGNTVDNHIGTP
jgi:hypothetical protein